MTDEVHTWIEAHEEEMIDFLMKYISYRSPTEEEAEVQREFLAPFFRDEMDWDDVTIVDVTDEQNRPNVNAVLAGDGDGNGKNILFNGHSDVVDVTAEDEAAWTKDPWNPSIQDGRLYGRGANDMKGPNTALIWAVKAVMESDVELRGDVCMSLVVGEELAQQEVGSIPATNAHLEEREIPICINMEPTNNEIHTKSSGTFDFRIEIYGKEIHTSQKNLLQFPQRHGIPQGDSVGVNATDTLRQIIEQFDRLEHQWNMRNDDEIYGSGGTPGRDVQGVGPISITCTILEAGDYIASIPGRATLKGQVYWPPYADDAELWQEMQDAVAALETTNDWLREHPPEMNWKEVVDWPAFEVPLDHQACQSLGAAYRDVTGEEPVYSGFKAVADNGYIQRDCGVDAISMGPGDISMGAHGPDEYLPLSQFKTAAQTYASLILEWCR